MIEVCLSGLRDNMWPHIWPQTDSMLGDIMSEDKQLVGCVTHGIYSPPSYWSL